MNESTALVVALAAGMIIAAVWFLSALLKILTEYLMCLRDDARAITYELSKIASELSNRQMVEQREDAYQSWVDSMEEIELGEVVEGEIQEAGFITEEDLRRM